VTPELKQRLKEAGAAKRAQTKLLKDIPPGGLQIACDHADEAGLDPTIKPGTTVYYLKRATPEQVAALQARIPWVVKEVWAYNVRGKRPVICFNARYLAAVLHFAVSHPGRYLSASAWVRQEELDVTVVQSAYSKLNTAYNRIARLAE
jgi:hypothetical protein